MLFKVFWESVFNQMIVEVIWLIVREVNQMKKLLFLGVVVVVFVGGFVLVVDLKFKLGEDFKFNWVSYDVYKKVYGDLKGEMFIIFGFWCGEDEKLVIIVFNYFFEVIGVMVKYFFFENYEQQIVIDMQVGLLLNIVILLQLGLFVDFVFKGFLMLLGDDMFKWIKDNYGVGQFWVDFGIYKGKDGKKVFFVFFYKVDLKFLVWYVLENFKEVGYKVLVIMEDLKVLIEKIVKDGGMLWCIGLGLGGVIGWLVIDWVEDLMLCIMMFENYDKWMMNELKFNDLIVEKVIDEFGWFVKNDKFVDGGVKVVVLIDFCDSLKGFFGVLLKCYMYCQVFFILFFFLDGMKFGKDVDFFYFLFYVLYLEFGKFVEGVGMLVMIVKDLKVVCVFVVFFQMLIVYEVWMVQLGFLMLYKGVNIVVYVNDMLCKEGELLIFVMIFCFDGFDLMFGKIGVGVFWIGMVDYVSGKFFVQVVDQIQKVWDGLK